jgi:hypothetical protein
MATGTPNSTGRHLDFTRQFDCTRIEEGRVSRQLPAVIIPLLMLAGCGQQATPEASPSASSTSTESATATPNPPSPVAAPPTQGPRTEKWVDLQVGDCVAEVPAVDLGAVTVDLVDCAMPHRAEVYLLAPIAVNAAVTDVANHVCTAGVAAYTGQPASAFAVTYLIDSRQDRTSDNPLPSTVICLIQGVDVRPVTGSAHK